MRFWLRLLWSGAARLLHAVCGQRQCAQYVSPIRVHSQVGPIDPRETSSQITCVPLASFVCAQFTSETLFDVRKWVHVSCEDLSEECNVGQGQSEGVNFGQSLFVRECWHVTSKFIESRIDARSGVPEHPLALANVGRVSLHLVRAMHIRVTRVARSTLLTFLAWNRILMLLDRLLVECRLRSRLQASRCPLRESARRQITDVFGLRRWSAVTKGLLHASYTSRLHGQEGFCPRSWLRCFSVFRLLLSQRFYVSRIEVQQGSQLAIGVGVDLLVLMVVLLMVMVVVVFSKSCR